MSSDERNSQVKIVFYNEVGTGQVGYVETMKIGLMYLSDYGYGASPEYWTSILNSDGYGTNNWLYLGFYEWLISRNEDTENSAFRVSVTDEGNVGYNNADGKMSLRPVFYLGSNVKLIGCTGTSSDPYKLSL